LFVLYISLVAINGFVLKSLKRVDILIFESKRPNGRP